MKTIEERAYDYVAKTHSQTDNDFQNAMNIAVAKGYIRGAKEQHTIDIDKACEILHKIGALSTLSYHDEEGVGPEVYEEMFRKAMGEQL